MNRERPLRCDGLRSLHLRRSHVCYSSSLNNNDNNNNNNNNNNSDGSARTVYPGSLAALIASFQSVPDPVQRYKQLLFLASSLPPLADEHKLAENVVPGCVSRVWLVGELRRDTTIINNNDNDNANDDNANAEEGIGKMYYSADADSQLTKGLAAVLVKGLSGLTYVLSCVVLSCLVTSWHL